MSIGQIVDAGTVDEPRPYEQKRLFALRSLGLLDTEPSEAFDRITRLASQIFDLPIAAVSLTDEDRQWFKSRVGLEATQVERHKAPCSQVATTNEFLVLNDLLAHEDYADSPLAKNGIRFYAGAPLITREGYGLGTMCVLGTEPREITDDERQALRDLASLVMAQIELEHAFGRIDPATQLPNRHQFIEDIEDLAREHGGETRHVMLIDLGDPRQIAQTVRVLGHGFVEEFVADVTRSIQEVIGESSKLYLIGSAQCAYLAEERDEKLHAAKTETLRRTIHKSVGCTNPPVLFSPSIGVVPFELGETPPKDILRMAHSAAEEARRGDRKVSFYSSVLDEAERRRYRLLSDICDAINSNDGQLWLAYQPRIDVASHRCVGAEALLRWQHPELGNISPGEFIPLIEQTALTRDLTAWVIDTAAAQMAEWQANDLDLDVSINISAENLAEGDFAARLIQSVQRHRIDPTKLEVELTEGAIVRKGPQALRQLSVIEKAGIGIAIDDFGTGYSNLAYLLEIPANVIKLDRSLVQTLTKEDRSRTLVRILFSTLRNLGYRVVAEGVETLELFEELVKQRCDEAQGFLFSPALPPRLLEQWIIANSGSQTGTEKNVPQPLSEAS